MILLDTNLLARMTNSASPSCAVARKAVQTLLADGEQVIIVPQNLYEFWVVATRSAVPSNGLGMTPEQASQWIGFFLRRFSLLTDRPELSTLWLNLVGKHGIKGFRAHDARLAAAMESYGVTRLLTFNGSDFRGLGLSIVDPTSL